MAYPDKQQQAERALRFARRVLIATSVVCLGLALVTTVVSIYGYKIALSADERRMYPGYILMSWVGALILIYLLKSTNRMEKDFEGEGAEIMPKTLAGFCFALSFVLFWTAKNAAVDAKLF